MEREKSLFVRLELPDGSEMRLERLRSETRLGVVKTRVEQDAGLLPHTYQLTYLDDAPLLDHKTLVEVDIVSGATLRLVVWRLWHDVLVAAMRGDVQQCVTKLRALGEKGDDRWRHYCGWCVLFMASHRGHYVLTATLLRDNAAPVNMQSPCGWTALHAAAKMGKWKALCILLDNGADVRITDKKGRTALNLAHSHENKKCEQSLSFCEWNLQKHSIVEQRKLEHDARQERNAATRRAHQHADSTHPVWLRGTQGQVYMLQTANPVTVRDTTSSTTKNSKITQTKSTTTTARTPKETESKVKFDYGWFDPLRAQKLVPSTHHVLTYSNPSSSQLQPRSLLNPDGYTQPPK